MLSSTPDGLHIAIVAQPGARRAGVVGIHGGRLKVAVTQVAEKGRANDAIVDVFAEAFGFRRSQVELIAGTTSRQKTLLVRGVTEDEFRALLHQQGLIAE